MNRYPPLKALVAFDAAMRTHSFTHAAEKLHVTPGAIGQQIQKLEEWLGVLLFTRQIRQVQPTADGLLYWERIQPALAQIADASEKLRDRRSMAVWLSMPPSFAAKWFPRRMARLLTRYPEIELHLNASTALVDFEREQIDLAIRYFEGSAANLDATLLFQDEARAYCSPGYAADLSLKQPDDLARATLLHTTVQPYWPKWLRHFSRLKDADIASIPRIHFDQGMVAIEAAKQGQGVVLSSALLMEEETTEGTLIEPFDCRLPLSSGYYVVHHRRLALRPAAAAVKEWLIEETA
ncbi:LysR substrate-binding domain-containing protein [Noviherbaspirillum sedimenti]|uniref:LysR family transcriptional regulator n=1 Tax=Noviherbaspirillum sedimenti TaxID=2320865 RepID=A0A3A3G064_9BURK|nr:LysR substrate-binding domain-containing protein [Noviherbaspirillum sedimenti]RJG01311.1 LysR family transcriptional regulator [Noviherbaspirillum sedimenti]